MKKLLLLASILAAFTVSSAMAAAKFSIVGTADLAMPSYKDMVDSSIAPGTLSGTTSGKAQFGGGLLVEFPLSNRVGLELGALYMTRKYDATMTFTPADGSAAQSLDVTFKHPYIQVPLMFNLHLNKFLTLGLGGYLNNGIGQISETRSNVEEKNSYDEAEFKRLDYGVAAGLGIGIPMGSKVAFIIDARYNMGLAEQYSPKADSTLAMKQKNNDVTGFVGFRFGANK